jgi:hypothetical protein
LGAQHAHRLRHRLRGDALLSDLLFLGDTGLLRLLLQLALALQLGLPLSLCLPLGLANAGDFSPTLLGKPLVGSTKLIAPLLLGLDLARRNYLSRSQRHGLPLR